MTRVHPTERIAEARALVAKLSTEEKARLVIGQDMWTTVPFDDAGLPSARGRLLAGYRCGPMSGSRGRVGGRR